MLALLMTTEYEGHLIASLGDMSLSDRPLIYEPLVITVIQTGFGESNRLRNILFLNDEGIWKCGQDNLIRRYNQKGEIVGQIETKSGYMPQDIAMTRYLIFTDISDRTINIIKSSQVQDIIQLESWIPCGVCGTSSYGEFLVIMVNRYDQIQVLRFSAGSKVKKKKTDRY